MENAVDALKMAAAILVFVTAITISFTLFNKAKSTADSIVTMRDRQGYLTSAELDGNILYTSSDYIEHGGEANVRNKIGVTTSGDRIVKVDDVVATITRYNKEKYGVTVVRKTSGEVLARFDSNTENMMRHWYNVSDETKENYAKLLNKNTATAYAQPKFLDGSNNVLEKELYKIDVAGNGTIKCGAPWYGNDAEINNRISAQLSGKQYKYNGQTFQRPALLDALNAATTIVEVTNEIDQSTYLKDGTEDTKLLQEYEMPTIEVIYIIQ